MSDAHHHRRRLLPVVLAALLTVSGCVAITPAPAPQGPRNSLAPAAATPAVLVVDGAQPPARTALADTGPDRPRGHHRTPGHRHEQQENADSVRSSPGRRAGHQAGTAGRQEATEPLPPPRRRQPAAAAPKPEQPRRPAHPGRTPRPAPAATYDMRALCRTAADQQINAALVDLCRNTYGR